MDVEERRLMAVAANPDRWFGAHNPPASPPETEAGMALVAAHRVWEPRRRAGVHVDLVALAEAERAMEAARREGVARFRSDLSGDSQETHDWLRRLGVWLPDDPDTGQPSLSHHSWSDAVVPPGSEEDWAAWCDLRRATAGRGALVSIRRCLGDDGRVHPEIDVCGAITGRMAIRRPALQALPGAMRGLLVASPGKVLVGGDIHAVEPSLAAWMSGDEALAADLAEADPYQALATRVFGPDAGAEERSRAKTSLLAQLYGQGTNGLARRLGVAPAAAEDLVAELRHTYPVLFGWLGGLDRHPLRETPWGRRLPSPPENRRFVARNWAIQGSAADAFRSAVASVARCGGPEVLWLPVHDELVVEVAPERAEGAARALRRALSPRLGDVQLRAEVQILGERWLK